MSERFFSARVLALASVMIIPVTYTAPDIQFKLGLEMLTLSRLEQLGCRKKDGCVVGLITNNTGKDQFGRRNVDLLLSRGINLKYLFGPEHGFDGTRGSEVSIGDATDRKTGLPIVSLYGNGTGKKAPPSIVKKVDYFLFDMQDCGMRHFTYISTLLQTMEMAAAQDKVMVVLDRPNPLGPRMEGPLVEPKQKSFISIAPIPIRHGMTIGEVARFFNQFVLQKPVKLHVVKMANYRRSDVIPVTRHASLSPGLRSRQSCDGYSFTGLLGEVRPFNVGLTSDHPFQLIALNKKAGVTDGQWRELASALKRNGFTGTLFEYYHEGVKKRFRGLKVATNNIGATKSFNAFLDVLSFFKKAGIDYSYAPTFDLAVGTPKLRAMLQGGFTRQEREAFAHEVNGNLQAFFDRARPLMLYDPLPRIAQMRFSV